MELPNEFKTYEPYRLHFAVVAGRRDDFNDTTRWHKRQLRSTNGIEILHFDNLCDYAKEKSVKILTEHTIMTIVGQVMPKKLEQCPYQF